MKLIRGDCRKVLPTLADAIVDALVTDPPAGIGFMGKEWDDFRRSRNGADAGRKNVFGRTSKKAPEVGRCGRTAFVEWLTPVMTECRRVLKPGRYGLVWALPRTSHWTATALEDAGFEIRDRIGFLFGTGFPKGPGGLKPAVEDWWLVRNPGEGVRPLNIDACRVPIDGVRPTTKRSSGVFTSGTYGSGRPNRTSAKTKGGRYPAHLVHDGSDEVLDFFATFGESRSQKGAPRASKHPGDGWGMTATGQEYDDSGTVARYFYAAKASKADRTYINRHPTVKNRALMKWLVRLITEEDDVVLDPFMGSGTTGVACKLTGRDFIGVEENEDYFKVAERRVEATPFLKGGDGF